MMQLEITDIQRGCTHDGPGLRTTVFLKGCPIHCAWCHNPETQRIKKEILYRQENCMNCLHCTQVCPAHAHREENSKHVYSPDLCIGCMKCTGENVCPAGAINAASKTMEVSEVLEQVLLDRVFYRRKGGLTVSGGEPTMQQDGLFALLEGAKAEGISTCIETCGVFSESIIPRLLSCVDLFLYDIKDTDEARLKANTGADVSQVVSNLLAIDRKGGANVIRCILIPEVNMDTVHMGKVAELFKRLSHCQYVELLPYHPYGLSKTEQLGRKGLRYRQPEESEIACFAEGLMARGIPVKLYGTLL